MLLGLGSDELSLLGAEISAIGDVIAVVVAEKQGNKENDSQVAELAVLSDSLILIGDILTLKGVLIQNQESVEKGKDIGKAQLLDTISSWLDVVSDIIALQGSLFEHCVYYK